MPQEARPVVGHLEIASDAVQFTYDHHCGVQDRERGVIVEGVSESVFDNTGDKGPGVASEAFVGCKHVGADVER